MREKLIQFRGNRSQEETAKLYGVTQQAWSQWEMGTKSPGVVIMKRLETDSGIPMEEMFADIFNNEDLLNEKEQKRRGDPAA